MKDLFEKMAENLLKTVGLKMIEVGENSLNTCVAIVTYEPDIPKELLNEMNMSY